MEEKKQQDRLSDETLKTLANVAVCLVILFLMAYGAARLSAAADITELLAPPHHASEAAAALANEVSLQEYRVEPNQRTHEVEAVFTVNNSSHFLVRDLVIDCRLQDRDGLSWGGARWVIYDSLAPGDMVSYRFEDKRYISHRVGPDTIACAISDLKTAGAAALADSGAGH